MPLLKLNTPPYYNNDQIANSLDPDDIFNVHLAGVPQVGLSVARRPGLKDFADTATGVQGDGLFYWEAKNLLVAVSGGSVFTVSSTGVCTDITTDSLVAGTPVTFADGQKLDSTPVLYMANGALVYSDDGGVTTAIAGTR